MWLSKLDTYRHTNKQKLLTIVKMHVANCALHVHRGGVTLPTGRLMQFSGLAGKFQHADEQMHKPNMDARCCAEKTTETTT